MPNPPTLICSISLKEKYPISGKSTMHPSKEQEIDFFLVGIVVAVLINWRAFYRVPRPWVTTDGKTYT